MKVIFLIGFFCLVFFAAGSTPAAAQDDTKARLTKALTTKRVLRVQFKTGAVVKGTVREVSDDHFKLKESGSAFVRDVRYAEVDALKEQSRFVTAMHNTGKVLAFLFTTKTGGTLVTTALIVARLVIMQKRHSRPPVLVTR